MAVVARGVPLDRDPVPGDPYEVKELARKLGDFLDDVGSALRSVRGLDGDSAVQGQGDCKVR